MFERFSAPAREAVVHAQLEARSLHHNYIGTEHLLLGLFAEEGATGARALRGFGVTPEKIREGVVEIIGRGPVGEPDAAALDSIGVDLDAVRERIEEEFGPGALERTRAARERRLRTRSRGRWWGRRSCEAGYVPLGPSPSGHIPLTPRAKKVLELSLREAVRMKHGYIGTEHVLLGLLREGEGIAALLLTRQGVTYEAAERRVLEDLDGGAGRGGGLS